MKKLIMILTAICTVGVVQAASVDWAINLGKENYANKSYYVFAGSDGASILEALAAFDTTTATALSDAALASGTLNAKGGKASGFGQDIGSETSLFMVVLNGTLDANQTFVYGTMNVSSLAYTPPATSPGTFTAYAENFTGNGTITAAGGGSGGIPEPTSGLLLLIGGSLLALRRKQK